jgi:hypothetical protein
LTGSYTGQAFTAKELTITLAPNGDAQVTMQYEFSIPESMAVFFRIADPAKELKNALEGNLINR